MDRLTDTQEQLRLIAVSAYRKVYRNRQQPTGAYRLLRQAQRKADRDIRSMTAHVTKASALTRILGKS